MAKEKVYMKISNGYVHKITILKNPILGYKYLGISQKEIKSQEEKQNDRLGRSTN